MLKTHSGRPSSNVNFLSPYNAHLDVRVVVRDRRSAESLYEHTHPNYVQLKRGNNPETRLVLLQSPSWSGDVYLPGRIGTERLRPRPISNLNGGRVSNPSLGLSVR